MRVSQERGTATSRATTPSRPLLQLEYATLLRRSTEVNPADGVGHRVSALAGMPITRRLRLNVIGRAGQGGVEEEIAPTDEVLLLGRLDVQPSRRMRVRTYGAHRWREALAGAPATLEPYAGM